MAPVAEVIEPKTGPLKLFERSGDPNDELDPFLTTLEVELGKSVDDRDSDLCTRVRSIIVDELERRRKLWQAEARNGSVVGSDEEHNGEKFSMTRLSKGMLHASKGVSGAMEKYCPLEKDITDQARQKFLQTTDDESAGVLIPVEIAGGWVEKFRPRTVALRMGAREITVSGNPYKVRRENAFIDPSWEPEGTPISVSPDPSMNFIEARPRKMSTLIEVTHEQLEDAPATDQWIDSQIEREFPIKLDAGILVGDGTGTSPTGANFIPGANTVDMQRSVIGSGTQNVTFDSLKQFQRELRRQNVPDENAKWIFHPDVFYDIETMHDKAVTGTNELTNVQQMERRMLSATPLSRLFGQEFGMTTLMPTGGAGNDRAILHGDLSVIWVPRWGAFTVRVSEHDKFREDLVVIKPRMRRDVMIVRPEALVRSVNYGVA